MKKKRFTVLSLFNGCGGAFPSLEMAGISVYKSYSSEIDTHAIKIARKNHPKTIELGDILNWRAWEIDQPDLIIFGSPCQDLSVAGKRKGLEGERSGLFYVACEILQHYKPKYFLMENVVPSKKNLLKITAELERVTGEFIYHRKINSALISAQNRNRIYWTNFKYYAPEDRGIFLKDILEEDVPEKYNVSTQNSRVLESLRKWLQKTDQLIPDKSYAICAKYSPSIRDYVEKRHSQIIVQRARGFNKGGVFVDKSPTVSSSSFQHNNHVVQLNPSKESGGKQPYMQNRVYSVEGKSPALTQLANMLNIFHIDRIRRLTPTECARLQGLEDNYLDGVSESQQYKMTGNGYQCDTVAWVLGFLPEAQNPSIIEENTQLSFC